MTCLLPQGTRGASQYFVAAKAVATTPCKRPPLADWPKQKRVNWAGVTVGIIELQWPALVDGYCSQG